MEPNRRPTSIVDVRRSGPRRLDVRDGVPRTPSPSAPPDDRPQQLAADMSSRLEQLWAEADRQVDRTDLDDRTARQWVEALDHLTLALQALEDVASPPSPSWGHREWYERRP